MSYTLIEWWESNGKVCPACCSANFYRVDHDYTFKCSYCLLAIPQEIMLITQGEDSVASVLYKLKRTWERRVEILNDMSTEALYDVLVQRGILQPKPETTSLSNIAKDIYGSMINAQFKYDILFLGKPSYVNEPKPWSYEEAAASEFNIDEGTGLQ